MAPISKNSTLFAKVCGRIIMMVEICMQPSKKNKANSYRWFTEQHFSRLTMKLEDVILARVLAPSETTCSKKKPGKTSHHDNSEILPDPELLIQYYFVKRRKYRQTALILSQQESRACGKKKTTGKTEYSGGGYQSIDIFPEKLKVTVSQTSLDHAPSLPGLAHDKAEERPSKSAISKYFNKGDADITHSSQKKRAALKNMNKKQGQQKRIDSLFCTSSSDSDGFTSRERDEKASGHVEPEIEGERKHNQITWVDQLDELDIKGNVASQGAVTSKKVEQESGLTSKERDEKAIDPGEIECESKRRVQVLDQKLNVQDNLAFQVVVTLKKVEQESELNSKERDVKASGSCDSKRQVKQPDQKLDIQDNLAFQEVASSMQKHTDESRNVSFSSSDACDNVSCTYSKSEEFKSTGNQDDKTLETDIKDKDNSSKPSDLTAAKLKRRRSSSESDLESLPSLRSRLAKRNSFKKHKTVCVNQTRKESDSDIVHIGEDNDFETPKVKRNAEKRKGSDISDDQDPCSLSSMCNHPGGSISNVEEGSCLKKRKTNRTNVTAEGASRRKIRKPVKKKINKRQVKTSSKTTSDVLEDASEEPGSSPLEPITIEDRPSVPLVVGTIEDLTADQTEQLVWEFAGELREIFEGKKYCRRHEDYKKGGRMKGDLAFQVQFGQFSEEQRDIIMNVLTAMFCYKHSKYFDYVSKVLLPETLVMIYMKVVGRSHDEAELSLLERTK